MENLLLLLFFVFILAVFVCVKLMRKVSNRKAAQSGEDKERVRRAAELLLAEGGERRTIYAHWEERESYGRSVRTTYYRYVVTYQNQTMCIAPLYIDKKTRQVQVGQPSIVTPERLGKVTVRTKKKDGVVKRIEVWLGDKQGHTLIELFMDAENLRRSRWYPVNIMQQEECVDFERFLLSLAQRVAAENPGVDDLIKAENNEGFGIIGAGISIAGAFFAFFFPPAGVILALIGLIMSMVSKRKGAKGWKVMIISILCTIWSAGFFWMYWTYFICQ
ncbi:hypothetical protein V1224_04555 [Lachnospiraceae bacterium JLR.KK008]